MFYVNEKIKNTYRVPQPEGEELISGLRSK